MAKSLFTIKGAGEISNRCTPEEMEAAYGFIVCEDTFMSGWGKAPGTSFYALALVSESPDEREIVLENAKGRDEMKNARFTCELPTLRIGDHLSITGPSSAARWYERGGFKKGRGD